MQNITKVYCFRNKFQISFLYQKMCHFLNRMKYDYCTQLIYLNIINFDDDQTSS